MIIFSDSVTWSDSKPVTIFTSSEIWLMYSCKDSSALCVYTSMCFSLQVRAIFSQDPLAVFLRNGFGDVT